MKPAKKTAEEITVITVGTELLTYNVLGTSPLILNAMSQKTRQQLILPPKKKNTAEKTSTLKHVPMEEYRASAYKSQGDTAPTRLLMMSTAFKNALRSVALDLPGATKAQLGRLAFVEGVYVHVYGVPQLFMSVVRNSDMAHTPDVRTRAIVPEWACQVAIRIMTPMLNATEVDKLFGAAGMMRGVGDWRPEKGSGSFGQFSLVAEDDPRFVAIVDGGGREAQDAALDNPACYDGETAELLTWFDAEVKRRGFKAVA